ncbi:unnamed protein product [Bursaphelenchus okinawaensis]|uniref:C2H2-type domain-containing protein n=1 Tax=Bursaphelenchus okinawaensis TaxID=465554 RepID=A0A811JW81_9BILA|nr:unnamed protein product [Bursaphelenchus okinawaensis]CAG9086579.1 unnamed protein product [Bursaphelenchus okinawaensis]
MEYPLGELMKNLANPANFQQQLNTLYSLQWLLQQKSKVFSPGALPLLQIQPLSPSCKIHQSIKVENVNTRSPTSFSIDELLKSVPSSSPKEKSIENDVFKNYTAEDLHISDGRCKRSPDTESTSRHVCSECGRSYATSSNLSRHKQTHRPLDSPYAKPCKFCGRVYVSNAALGMHLLTHDAQHKCEDCGKLFSRRWLLKNHMRSHTGQKPYRCAHCGKAFADRSNLRAHMHTHTGEKKFKCNNCHKSFALKSYLNKHKEQVCVRRKLSQSPESLISDFGGGFCLNNVKMEGDIVVD